MFVIDVVREFAYGLKLGARHAVNNRHGLTEAALSPSLPAARKNGLVAGETFGR